MSDLDRRALLEQAMEEAEYVEEPLETEEIESEPVAEESSEVQTGDENREEPAEVSAQAEPEESHE